MSCLSPVNRLGRSGLQVSRISLGTMTFGGRTDLPEARRIAERALEAGVFFWDTADMYSAGRSEQMVGRLLEGRRQDVVLATKAWARMGPGANDQGLSARHLRLACEASLRRLQTDWIDLFYLHLPDRSVPLEETLRTVEDLRREGKIRYWACSNYRAWEVVDLVHTARAMGCAPLTAVQPLYNMCNRGVEVELLPAAWHHGVGVVSYSPLARGVLTGKYSWQADAPQDSRLSNNNPRFLQAEWRESSLKAADRLAQIAAERGLGLAQLATAWALANRRVDSIIAGPRTLEQLEGYLQALSVDWDRELEEAVDAVVYPGTHTGEDWPDPAYYPVTGRVLS